MIKYSKRREKEIAENASFVSLRALRPLREMYMMTNEQNLERSVATDDAIYSIVR